MCGGYWCTKHTRPLYVSTSSASASLFWPGSLRSSVHSLLARRIVHWLQQQTVRRFDQCLVYMIFLALVIHSYPLALTLCNCCLTLFSSIIVQLFWTSSWLIPFFFFNNLWEEKHTIFLETFYIFPFWKVSIKPFILLNLYVCEC